MWNDNRDLDWLFHTARIDLRGSRLSVVVRGGILVRICRQFQRAIRSSVVVGGHGHCPGHCLGSDEQCQRPGWRLCPDQLPVDWSDVTDRESSGGLGSERLIASRPAANRSVRHVSCFLGAESW